MEGAGVQSEAQGRALGISQRIKGKGENKETGKKFRTRVSNEDELRQGRRRESGSKLLKVFRPRNFEKACWRMGEWSEKVQRPVDQGGDESRGSAPL